MSLDIGIKAKREIYIYDSNVTYNLADISVNKYYYNENTYRYYEINFDVFSPYDYSSEKETIEKAKEWLYEELKQLQENVKLGDDK